MSGLLASILLLAALCGDGAAAPARQEIGAEREVRPPIERLRARLRARPKEERTRLERHLAEFEKLTPEARSKVLRRARTLRERERALEADAPDALGAREETEPGTGGSAVTVEPEGLRELRRARLRERFRERGREVRERIPPVVQRWLEKAPPELRRRYLELLDAERELLSLRALSRLRDRHGLTPQDIHRFERLPLDERLQALRQMRARGARGRPAGARRDE